MCLAACFPVPLASACFRFPFALTPPRLRLPHLDNRTTSTSTSSLVFLPPRFASGPSASFPPLLPFCKHFLLVSLKSSPRPISTVKLHALLRFHRRPIYPVVCWGPYLFPVGTLFSRGASRLDAFSVYPFRTSLPCYAVGTTTVAPVVRPLRSSRTRSSSSHDSYAHDG